mmetsp:Transcript_176708/g.566670  ORF Transcript_176708/g.566670 Transcript_176708/m.566670 type:complete len:204 (-) Transcript_176708:3336-3947(-)
MPSATPHARRGRRHKNARAWRRQPTVQPPSTHPRRCCLFATWRHPGGAEARPPSLPSGTHSSSSWSVDNTSAACRNCSPTIAGIQPVDRTSCVPAASVPPCLGTWPISSRPLRAQISLPQTTSRCPRRRRGRAKACPPRGKGSTGLRGRCPCGATPQRGRPGPPAWPTTRRAPRAARVLQSAARGTRGTSLLRPRAGSRSDPS